MSKRLGYFKIVDREKGIGNRDSGTKFLFLIEVCNTNVSKVQIGNKEPAPGSFLTIFGFVLFVLLKKTVPCSFFTISGLDDLGFCIFHHHVRQQMLQAN